MSISRMIVYIRTHPGNALFLNFSFYEEFREMPISLFLSLPQVAQSFVCITVDHYGKWALVAAAAVAGGNGDGCI